jgi:hypothetical protein
MMFVTLPAGCIAHLVTDSYSMPHIRPKSSSWSTRPTVACGTSKPT